VRPRRRRLLGQYADILKTRGTILSVDVAAAPDRKGFPMMSRPWANRLCPGDKVL